MKDMIKLIKNYFERRKAKKRVYDKFYTVHTVDIQQVMDYLDKFSDKTKKVVIMEYEGVFGLGIVDPTTDPMDHIGYITLYRIKADNHI